MVIQTLESYTDIKNPLKTICSMGKFYCKSVRYKIDFIKYYTQICACDLISTRGKNMKKECKKIDQSLLSE